MSASRDRNCIASSKSNHTLYSLQFWAANGDGCVQFTSINNNISNGSRKAGREHRWKVENRCGIVLRWEAQLAERTYTWSISKSHYQSPMDAAYKSPKSRLRLPLCCLRQSRFISLEKAFRNKSLSLQPKYPGRIGSFDFTCRL